jgi:ubiquinone/menaquinone biosynthesis C-methylase UbiE
MTDEMLDLARRNQVEAGIENVEFLKGEIEAIPLPDHSIDVIISNCVINLSVDKPGVFKEAHRVLKPGGRFAVTDIVTTRRFTEEEQSDLAAWTGCLAGALYRDDFVAGLVEAGFHEVEMEVTHDVAPGAVSAIIRATA